jgi:hypothetical protein
VARITSVSAEPVRLGDDIDQLVQFGSEHAPSSTRWTTTSSTGCGWQSPASRITIKAFVIAALSQAVERNKAE